MKFLSDILAKAGLVVDGVVQLNNTATGQTPASGDNSTKLATTAFVKNQNYLTGNQTITLSGDATGSGTTSIAVTLANSGVTAGTYGNASNIPTITVDAKGRVTSITTTAVSIVTTLAGLSDVTLTNPADKQVLQYNAATGKWVNASANIDPATTSTLGTIIVGAGLSVTAQGVLSVNGTGSARSVETFTATSGQTTFTVAQSYTVGLVDVYVNGVRLSSASYTASNGTTVVLADAAVAGDIIDIVKYTPLSGLAFTTDNVPEGTVNLYFTNARARAAISLTTTGTSGAATYNSSTGVLNIPQYQTALVDPVTGTGTTNYAARWTSSSTLGIGVLFDNGTNVGVNTNNPGHRLDVNGTGRFVNRLTIDADIYFTNYATTGIVITGPNVVYPLITIGSQNTASGNTNIIIGQSNQGTGAAYILGASNIANSNGAVTIGQGNQANSSGQFTVLIGGNNTTSHGVGTFTGTFAIGNANVLAHQASAIMGSNQTTTASNQLIIAATQSNVNTAGFNDIYFGTGPRSKNTNLLGSNITINGSGAGAGSDLSGGNVTIAGGKGTGTGTPGDVVIATASTTTSGSTLQSLTNRWWIKSTTGQMANVASPNAAAVFQLDSTTRGFLPPRMTAAQRGAISSPPVGLVVYQTDSTEGLWAYTASGWKALALVN